jgi:hypothetical protein
MIAVAVEEFGALIGIDRLAFDVNGELVLEIEPADTLCLRHQEEDLVVGLSRARQYPCDPPAVRMLELLHYQYSGGRGIHCRRADFGRATVLMEVLAGGGLRGDEILRSLDRLTALHNTAEAV